MGEKKKHQTPEEFVAEAKETLKKLKDCDFEEFRDVMTDFAGELLKGEVMIMEWQGEERQKLFNLAAGAVKGVRAQNDKDFKTAERNFKHVDRALEEFAHQAARAETAAMVSLMRCASFGNVLASKGFMINDCEVGNLAALRKKQLTFIRKFFNYSVKDFDDLITRACERAEKAKRKPLDQPRTQTQGLSRG